MKQNTQYLFPKVQHTFSCALASPAASAGVASKPSELRGQKIRRRLRKETNDPTKRPSSSASASTRRTHPIWQKNFHRVRTWGKCKSNTTRTPPSGTKSFEYSTLHFSLRTKRTTTSPRVYGSSRSWQASLQSLLRQIRIRKEHHSDCTASHSTYAHDQCHVTVEDLSLE